MEMIKVGLFARSITNYLEINNLLLGLLITIVCALISISMADYWYT